jgi:hypothetical protein
VSKKPEKLKEKKKEKEKKKNIKIVVKEEVTKSKVILSSLNKKLGSKSNKENF